MFGFTGTGALALSLANEVWTVWRVRRANRFRCRHEQRASRGGESDLHQSVANYRQTVLTAFQQVEDELAAIRILARQQKVIDDAVKAAQKEVDVLLNQYQAGTVAFTAVVVAQAHVAYRPGVRADGEAGSLSCRRRADRGARRRMGYRSILPSSAGVGDEIILLHGPLTPKL